MKEVVAIIRPERWQATREVIERFDVVEVAHVRALGRGRQRGLRYLRRVVAETGGGVTEEVGGMQFLAKRIVTWLVPDDRVREFVATVIRVNQTGNFGGRQDIRLSRRGRLRGLACRDGRRGGRGGRVTL